MDESSDRVRNIWRLVSRLLPDASRTSRIFATISLALVTFCVQVPSILSAQSSRLVVGVLPFDASRADTALTSLGYGIADLVATDLAIIRRLRVVERLRLGEVMREQNLALGAGFDPSRAPAVGQLMKANRLVAGALLPGDRNSLLFEARILNVESGVVDTAIRHTADPVDILDAQKQITFGLLARMGVELTPRERSIIEQRPTKNLSAVLAYGQGVEEELNGNFAAARRAFRRAAELDPSFRRATERLQQSEVVAIQSQGRLVQDVVDVVNPTLPRIPTQPPVGTAVSPGVLPTASVIILITRP